MVDCVVAVEGVGSRAFLLGAIGRFGKSQGSVRGLRVVG